MDDLPLAAWHALCPETPPGDVELLGPHVWRVGDVVLKRFPDASAGKFRRLVRAHRQAGRIFRGVPGLAAQRLHGFDERHRSVLLAYVPGHSGRMALLNGAAPIRILAQAGAWLQHLHAGRPVDEAAFTPKPALRRLDPDPVCADDPVFRAALTRLHVHADTLDGRPARHAVLHGDMTLANLLTDGTTVTGIDFENLARHPAARDIGELWADLLLHVRELPADATPMPAAWQQAFASTYPEHDAEVALFYTRHRLLRTWSAIPAHRRDRGPHRLRQLANLRSLAQNGAFA